MQSRRGVARLPSYCYATDFVKIRQSKHDPESNRQSCKVKNVQERGFLWWIQTCSRPTCHRRRYAVTNRCIRRGTGTVHTAKHPCQLYCGVQKQVMAKQNARVYIVRRVRVVLRRIRQPCAHHFLLRRARLCQHSVLHKSQHAFCKPIVGGSLKAPHLVVVEDTHTRPGQSQQGARIRQPERDM